MAGDVKNNVNFLKFLRHGRGGPHTRKEPRFDMPVGIENLKKIFADCGDFVVNEVRVGGEAKLTASLCFIDGIVSGDVIDRDVIRPLTSRERFGEVRGEAEAVRLMSEGLVTNYTVRVRRDMDSAVEDILSGFCAVVFGGERCAVTFEAKGGERRAVGEAQTEKTVKGAKDAFTEVFRTNTGLIRRRMRNPDLRVSEMTVGRQTLSKIAVLYIEGITDPAMVGELRARLGLMDVDSALSAASIEEYAVEKTGTPFPQIQMTEKPDRVCTALLEGRAAILADGLPFGFLVPGTFAEFMKVPEDMANHFIVASALTLLRYASMMISLLLPAVYVAITMFHQEMMPTQLMLSIIESKQEVPFSTAVEILGMMLALELLQEASLRLPQNIGDTMGIIGALIVGQSAVEAKVISPAVVIVAAVAGITGYTVPDQDLSAALRLFRFLFAVMALLMGLYGIVLGVILLVWHLSTLENFGVPYLWPFSGSGAGEISQALLRWPLRARKYRKSIYKTGNKRERR